MIDPLPRFAVPLAEGDAVTLDLQGAYNATYSGARIFARLADYTRPPVNADAYTDADQRRIAALMHNAQS